MFKMNMFRMNKKDRPKAVEMPGGKVWDLSRNIASAIKEIARFALHRHRLPARPSD